MYGGYRYGLLNGLFVEGEVFASKLNGRTDTGNTDFENYYGLTVGLGGHFAPRISGVGFVGLAEVESENSSSGSQSDNGTIIGLSLGYDVTSRGTVSVRYSHINVDGDFGDVKTDTLGIRYSHRF